VLLLRRVARYSEYPFSDLPRRFGKTENNRLIKLFQSLTSAAFHAIFTAATVHILPLFMVHDAGDFDKIDLAAAITERLVGSFSPKSRQQLSRRREVGIVY
jgi:hypothetical protein